MSLVIEIKAFFIAFIIAYKVGGFALKLNGSQILMEVLVEEGVDTVFGYPGGAVLNIYDALYQNRDRIHHVITAHEQGAAHAADGYARATGKTGVCISTSGPGATNLVTGIATAYMDSIPMVAITGNVSTKAIGRDSFQEVYIAGITMPITKHNFVVYDIKELAETLREAFRIAQSGRPGPVLVDIPKDITAAVCEYESQKPCQIVKNTFINKEILAKVADVINKAEKPILYFGGGVVASEAYQEVRHLMHKAKIPACHTIMATGVLSYEDPLNLGMVGMHGNVSSSLAVENADLLIAVGARFSDRVATNTNHFAPHAQIIHIDIDKAEFNKNIENDYSIIGDVKTVLQHLMPLIQEKEHKNWMEKVKDWKKENYKPEDSETLLHPHQIMKEISNFIGEEGIIATDVGQHQMWAAQYCHRTEPRCFITSGGLGTMGFGYGAAIGAKVARPEKRVVHVTGDGSFHMNLNELCTTVSFQIPVVTVIMNNQVLGMVRQWQTTFYDKRYSCTTLERKTDYVKLADAFGAKGYRCHTPEELHEALQKAAENQGPTIIECLIDRDEKVLPMIPAGGTVEDIMMK